MSLNQKKGLVGDSQKIALKSSEGYPMRKKVYGEKLIRMLETSQKILVVGMDHIGSTKLSELRKIYRGKARFLFGKNTLIRRIIRQYVRVTRRLEVSSLLPALHGNCCLIFLNGNPSVYDMVAFQNEIVNLSRVSAAPRAGDVAPCDVWIRPMDTGLEPTRTAFFAAMNIATRINRGQVQITNSVCVVRRGERVTPSAAALCHALNMKPFSFAIEPVAIYDEGECYPAQVAQEFDPNKMVATFNTGVEIATALSLGIGYPNLLTVPHSVCSAYFSMIALGVGGLSEYTWDGLEHVKKRLQETSQKKLEAEDGLDIDAHSTNGYETSPEPVIPFDPFRSDTEDSDSDD